MIASMGYKFESVDGSEKQIIKLYQLLKKRVHSISHGSLPDYKSHFNFVKNHPYLHWFIVMYNGDSYGSFYIKKDNSIGINFKTVDSKILAASISFIKENFKPQTAQPSIVPEYFYINVASSNKELIDMLTTLNISPLQISFRI